VWKLDSWFQILGKPHRKIIYNVIIRQKNCTFILPSIDIFFYSFFRINLYNKNVINKITLIIIIKIIKEDAKPSLNK